MVRYVEGIREPARTMCGAGGFQPGECFLSGAGLRESFPRFHQALVEMFEGWISSGFHEAASLGWPLRPSGGMFISINRWKRQSSATCLFRTLFTAVHAMPDVQRSECLQKCPPQPKRVQDDDVLQDDVPEGERGAWSCHLDCWWQSVQRLPQATVRAVQASHPACSRLPRKLGFLEQDRFEMSHTDMGSKLFAYLTQMHGWLALKLNDTSTWQGFHGWHMDGPPAAGRSHKVFVLVSKNRSTARMAAGGDDAQGPTGRRLASAASTTNLVAASAGVRYAQNCEMSHIDEFDYSTACESWMQPGDVLFFREDVHHRTQDALLDRVALIVDVLRLPLRTTPRSMSSRRAGAGERDHDKMPYSGRDTSPAGDSGQWYQKLQRAHGGVKLACNIETGNVNC